MSLTFHDVSKSFAETAVLSHVSLTLSEEQTYFLSGASGAGKTTLLRLIAGLEKPSSGRIEIPSRRISFAFQEPRLFPQLTVRENILAITPRVSAEEILAVLDLTEAEGKYPHELSGGMKKRAGLARALAADADIFLLDEPTAGQDADHAAMVARAILKYTSDATVFIATHDTALMQAVKAQTITIKETGILLD